MSSDTASGARAAPPPARRQLEQLSVDGIDYRRDTETGARARAALAAGDVELARLHLLTEVDDWWPFEPPTLQDARAAVAAPTLREAVAALRYDRVGDYLVHRWSDPTYLSGLALLQLVWPAASRGLVEVACGHGAFLRDLALRGAGPLTGVDVVFAKLWLARRFVVPDSVALVCADVLTQALPGPAEVAFCHDAIYFLPDAERVAAEMRRVAPTVVIGHAHVADPGGVPRPPQGWAGLLPGGSLYDDAELTAALLSGVAPAARAAESLTGAEAVAVVAGETGWRDVLADPVAGARLRTNPLFDAAGARRWPSQRWADEYGGRAASYLPASLPDPLPADAARRRIVLELPEAW